MDTYCRLCLESKLKLTYTFEEREGLFISTIVHLVCSIEIDRSDRFSQSVCEACLDTVMKANSLRIKSLESKNYLLEQIRKILPSECNRDNDDGNSEVITITEDEEEEEIETEKIINYEPKEDVSIVLDDTDEEKKAIKTILKRVRKKNRLRFKCGKCKNRFARDYEFVLHKKIHEVDAIASTFYETGKITQNRVCSVCRKKFNDLNELLKHWHFLHCPQSNPISCAYCDFRSKDKSASLFHVVQKHKDLAIDKTVILVKLDQDDKSGQRIAVFVNPLQGNTEINRRRVQDKINAQLNETRTEITNQVQNSSENNSATVAHGFVITEVSSMNPQYDEPSITACDFENYKIDGKDEKTAIKDESPAESKVINMQDEQAMQTELS